MEMRRDAHQLPMDSDGRPLHVLQVGPFLALVDSDFELISIFFNQRCFSLPLVVRLGEHDLSDSQETVTEDYEVSEIVIHPGWGTGKLHSVRIHERDWMDHSLLSVQTNPFPISVS